MSKHDSPWWDQDMPDDLSESKVHEVLFKTVRSIEERQYSIHRMNLQNSKLYNNREMVGLDWNLHTERMVTYGPASFTAENLTASVVDTVTALISKNWAKATPVIKDADFETEMAAQSADRYLYGEMKRLNAWTKLQRMFNDACWAQIGAIRIDIDDQENEIYMERVNPDEIIVDQRQCLSDMDPTEIHHRRLISVQALKEMFPDRSEELEYAAKAGTWTTARNPAEDNMVICESWRLPYWGPDGEKHAGRHSIVFCEGTLLDEDYDREVFPLMFFRWKDLGSGFYGQSLVEQLTPFQLRLNELNQTIRKSQDLISVPRIFVEAGTKLQKEQINNGIAKLIPYRGKPPIVMNWQAVHPELYSERERTRSSAFEYAGISQLSAQAKLPDNARLDSSKALREYSMRENERFSLQAQSFEALIPELAEHILELSAILYKNGTNKKVTFMDRSLVDEIDWAVVAKFFKERRYVFQLEASSIMNMTPAAREDIINNWANQGIIDLSEYKALLNNPDIEEAQDLGAMGIDDIKWTASQLDKGTWLAPEPEQDLNYGVGYMQKMLLKRRRQFAPEGVKRLYRNWIANAKHMLDEMEARANVRKKMLEEQAMMQMQEQGMAPGGMPGAPPGMMPPGDPGMPPAGPGLLPEGPPQVSPEAPGPMPPLPI
jgi:hypothetical protein